MQSFQAFKLSSKETFPEFLVVSNVNEKLRCHLENRAEDRDNGPPALSVDDPIQAGQWPYISRYKLYGSIRAVISAVSPLLTKCIHDTFHEN